MGGSSTPRRRSIMLMLLCIEIACGLSPRSARQGRPAVANLSDTSRDNLFSRSLDCCLCGCHDDKAYKRRLAVCMYASFRETKQGRPSFDTNRNAFCTHCHSACVLSASTCLAAGYNLSQAAKLSTRQQPLERLTTVPQMMRALVIVLLVLLLAVDQERKPERVLCGLTEK